MYGEQKDITNKWINVSNLSLPSEFKVTDP